MTDLIPTRPDWVTRDSLPEPGPQSPEARAFQAESERDSWQQFAVELADKLLVEPAAGDDAIEPPEGNPLVSIVESLYDDWAHGVAVDDLEAGPLVRGWAEETGQL